MNTRRAEDEYFIKESAEEIKRLKERMEQDTLERERLALKELCDMRCPKCARRLEQALFHGLKIEMCTFCKGVWLDNGNLKKLLGPVVEPGKKTAIKEIIDLFIPH